MKHKLQKRKILRFGLGLLFVLFGNLSVLAQTGKMVKGTVTDSKNEPVIGASVVLKDKATVGVATDVNGAFTLTVPSGNQTLVVSYLGMKTKEVNVTGKDKINIVLEEDLVTLSEVVVNVGYGQQKKVSVTGAITQVGSEALERNGGVPSLGQALAGKLPGVITYTSTGLPGDEDPRIVIRSQDSWNNSDPLVLVDGIERPISMVDIASVDNISVLKDASATAVYGVKGANGVILITTKRGQEGKANVQIKASSTMKVASKLPKKYDAYDTFILKNDVLERELMLNQDAWSIYTPMSTIMKYRYPANSEEWDRYPNVDWENELFNQTAMAYNVSTNVSGGTDLVKYFSSLDYQHEGDLFKTFDNNRGYNPRFTFDRLNVRSNLDLDLTKTTRFSSNLFGSYGLRTRPWGAYNNTNDYWISVYRTAPDAMRPVYSDGTYGFYAPANADVPNSVANLAVSGLEQQTTTRINADFVLSQKLDVITKGLSAKATLSLDNSLQEVGRGINDLYNYPVRKWVDPHSGITSYERGEDYTEEVRWQYQTGSINVNQTYRRKYYAAQLDYARQFGKHNVTAMGLFSREEWATGSEFRHYREDWAFRTTYNYALKYLLEFNCGYNGSERFGPKYRFGFFPAISGGWTISEESFMKSLSFLDMLKVRASWGKIGDDNVTGGSRWGYQDQWVYSGNTTMGDIPVKTPYTIYRIASLGNPNLHWETVEKRNLGIDYAFLKGIVAGSADFFKDHRTDIMITDRAIPSYFGVPAPAANLGEVKSKGYELEIRLNYEFTNHLRLWLNANMTHATNKVLYQDDPELTPAYLKSQGYKIDQNRSYIDNGFLRTWDDVYGSTERDANNASKLPGDYQIVDFNGDGQITTDDQAPYQYSGIPENTYSISGGLFWKGFSFYLQFYGVNNVSRIVDFPTFNRSSDIAYVEGTYWTVSNGGNIPMPRFSTVAATGYNGTRYVYDGSYVRLKNAEIAYTLSDAVSKKLRMKSCKIFLNGDNLLLWTKMPDDRENNFTGSASTGAYPTVRRFNMGFDLTF